MVDVDLRLDEAGQLVVASSVAALLQIDFDLEGSHEVNLGTTPVTVTAAPFLVASLEPVDTREFRVRGPLVSVSPNQGRYVVDLRPFNQDRAGTARSGSRRRRTRPARSTATSSTSPTASPRSRTCPRAR